MIRLLRLYTDAVAANGARSLGDANRVIYVREGEVTVRAAGRTAILGANSAWHGAAACEATGGTEGATLLRWELVTEGAPDREGLTLEARIELGAIDGYLMRCDRVDFPPGGVAYTHTHQGPGIRCLLAGELRVDVNRADVNNDSHLIKPEQAWFEAGPDPVLATAAARAPTSFVRCMILPRALKGKSSIRYLRPEDADKPKTQKYQIFADDFIDL